MKMTRLSRKLRPRNKDQAMGNNLIHQIKKQVARYPKPVLLIPPSDSNLQTPFNSPFQTWFFKIQ
jgi:hypothetical protein